jgi:hypothetical protein
MRILKKTWNERADIGSALSPAYAPALPLATQVSNFLVNQNKDDVLVKFTFKVYPRQLQPSDRVAANLGVPQILAVSSP